MDFIGTFANHSISRVSRMTSAEEGSLCVGTVGVIMTVVSIVTVGWC